MPLLDVDLESSAMTNALSARRMGQLVTAPADTPAAYVRAADLAVERLDQTCTRADDDGELRCFDYHAPVFDFACRLTYDPSGPVTDYPGLATRAV